MCNRSNNPVLGFLAVFVLGLILSLGHIDAAQAQTGDPAPGVYNGSVKFTDGATTTTGRAEMKIYLNRTVDIVTDDGFFPHMYR